MVNLHVILYRKLTTKSVLSTFSFVCVIYIKKNKSETIVYTLFWLNSWKVSK